MKQQFTKTFALLALVSALAAVGVATVNAQFVPLRANIPFAFHVGGKTLPAGRYQVESLSSSSDLIKVVSAEQKTGAFALKNTTRAKSEARQSKLVFRRYGSDYFLAQIITAGTEVGSELPASKAEREIIKKQPTRYLARRAAPDYVTVVVTAE